ncbi:MAG TPA: hypothetical protein PKD75_01795 [Tepidiformaceae bacterium]|nr:hypothetical protein [Tepidiformaceae bacterium]
MGLEHVVVGLARIAGSLPVPRWAFVGVRGRDHAVLVDLSDLFMMNLLDLGGRASPLRAGTWPSQARSRPR